MWKVDSFLVLRGCSEKVWPILLLLFLGLLAWSRPEFGVSFLEVFSCLFLNLHKCFEKDLTVWLFVKVILSYFKKVELILSILISGDVWEYELFLELLFQINFQCWCLMTLSFKLLCHHKSALVALWIKSLCELVPFLLDFCLFFMSFFIFFLLDQSKSTCFCFSLFLSHGRLTKCLVFLLFWFCFLGGSILSWLVSSSSSWCVNQSIKFCFFLCPDLSNSLFWFQSYEFWFWWWSSFTWLVTFKVFRYCTWGPFGWCVLL